MGFADILQNLGVAVAGNLAGGLAFVTFARAVQGLRGLGGEGPRIRPGRRRDGPGAASR